MNCSCWLLLTILALVVCTRGEVEFNVETGDVDFEAIKRQLRFGQTEVDFLKSRFDLANLELVYPASLTEVERQGQCMLGAFVLEDTIDELSVLLKLQRKETVTAWFSSSVRSGKRTYCARDIGNMKNCYERLVSVEYHAAKLFNKRSAFLRLFPDLSLPLNASAASIGISPRSHYYNSNIQVYYS